MLPGTAPAMSSLFSGVFQSSLALLEGRPLGSDFVWSKLGVMLSLCLGLGLQTSILAGLCGLVVHVLVHPEHQGLPSQPR